MINPEVIFYHIPKCGGSSIRRMMFDYFKNIYREEQIYDPENTEKKINLFHSKECIELEESYSKEYIENIKVLLCHVRCKFLKEINEENKFTFTFLRNPAYRVISHYEFFDKHLYNNSPMSELTDEELKKYCTGEEGDVMTMVLGGKDRKLETAIQNMKKISFVGKLENFEEDIKKLNILLNKKFRKNIDINPIHENKNYENKINKSLLSRVEKFIKNSKDFKLYNSIKMNNILFHGNCQISSLSDIINFKDHFNTIEKVITHKTEIKQKEMLDIIKKANVIVTSFITDNYREKPYLSTKYILENCKENCKVVVITNMFFEFYYPDLQYLNFQGKSIGEPMPYHHKNLIDFYKEGKSIKVYTENVVNNIDFYSKEYLEELYERSISTLKQREKTIEDYKKIRTFKNLIISEFIENNYKKKLLFNSMNHPTKYLLQFASEKIVDFLNIPRENIDYNKDTLSNTKSILYKSIEKVVDFSIKDFQPCIKDRKVFNSEILCELYYKEYETINI